MLNKKFILLIIIIFIIILILKKNIKKKLPKKLGVSMPGCAFGSLTTLTGYYRSLFVGKNKIDYKKFSNPNNTIFSVCSGGNFLLPVFNGNNPDDLFGEYQQAEYIDMDTSYEQLGLLLDSYNIFETIKHYKLEDIFQKGIDKKKQFWDSMVKHWYDLIDSQRINNQGNLPKANYMSIVAGIKPTLTTRSNIIYKYLLLSNLNNMNNNLYVVNMKNEKPIIYPKLFETNQTIDSTYWASSAMGIFSATYLTSHCKKDKQGTDNSASCFAPYADCEVCNKEIQKKQTSLKKIAKNVPLWNILKNTILESAYLYGLNQPYLEKIYFTDGGVIDVNAIIFNLVNQCENLLIFNINQCNGLEAYFGKKSDEFCFLIQQVFSEKTYTQMKNILINNYENKNVEFGILDNIEVKENKRFGIKPYTIKKMFIINLVPTLTAKKRNTTTANLFLKSEWFKNLPKNIKNYIKKEVGPDSKNRGFFLENGCFTGSRDKYVPKKLDAKLIANYCTWQMNIMLEDKNVKNFFINSI